MTRTRTGIRATRSNGTPERNLKRLIFTQMTIAMEVIHPHQGHRRSVPRAAAGQGARAEAAQEVGARTAGAEGLVAKAGLPREAALEAGPGAVVARRIPHRQTVRPHAAVKRRSSLQRITSHKFAFLDSAWRNGYLHRSLQKPLLVALFG